MKPYGRKKKVMQNPNWKRDYHLHEKGRKLPNWWESICECLSRSTIKHKVKQDMRKAIEE